MSCRAVASGVLSMDHKVLVRGSGLSTRKSRVRPEEEGEASMVERLVLPVAISLLSQIFFRLNSSFRTTISDQLGNACTQDRITNLNATYKCSANRIARMVKIGV